MRRTLTVSLVTAALLLGSVAMVAAADYCLSTGANTLVLKAFLLPAKGVCKETRGFYPKKEDPATPVFWVFGMACGNTNGAFVTFVHTGVDDNGQVAFTDKFALNRTTLSGSGKECLIDTGSGTGCVDLTVSKVPCVPANVPVPPEKPPIEG